jgi:hypothetical protein
MCYIDGQKNKYSVLQMGLTITILDIIRRPVSCLKHDIWETGFCPRLQMEYTVSPGTETSLQKDRPFLERFIEINMVNKFATATDF